MKILITREAGFIGSHLVDRLINDGYKVIVIDNLNNSLAKKLLNWQPKTSLEEGTEICKKYFGIK